jgi:uncharacterized membrane protein
MSRVTTERGLDRLVNFSDAVTAVAVTLLVLPLIDLVGEGQTVADLFNEYSAQLISFIAVFFLMISIWTGHHRFWELIVDYDSVLLWLNAMWLLFLSLVPVIAGFTFESGPQHGQAFAYLVLLALLSLTLSLMKLYVSKGKGRALLSDAASDGHLDMVGGLILVGGFAVTAGLILLWPDQVGWLINVAFLAIVARLVVQRRRTAIALAKAESGSSTEHT